MMRSRREVEKRVAAYYTEKMGGAVWCYFDKGKRAYCIRGEKLPAHPDLRDKYPNGWGLLDYVKPTKARSL